MNIRHDLVIRNTSPNDANAWDTFLTDHPDGNFYQLYRWKDIIEQNFGHPCYYLIAEQEGKIVGVFPLVYINSRIFGKIISSMPFVNFGGICAETNSVTEKLLEYARALTRELEADYLELRSVKSVSDDLPSALHKISMAIDLKTDPDEIWNGFKSKHRTNIRRVYKQDVHVKQGRHELLDTFYNLMARSWKNLGTPIYRKSYFKSVLDQFPEQTRIFIVYQGKTPIATAFNGEFNGTIEGMWAGALPEYRRLQPNYVLYWEMVKGACERGFSLYHLGRSTVGSGAEDFKKKWNAYPRQLYWQYILNKQDTVPQLNVDNPKFALAIKVWRKLPLPVTTLIGPLVAKNIP